MENIYSSTQPAINVLLSLRKWSLYNNDNDFRYSFRLLNKIPTNFHSIHPIWIYALLDGYHINHCLSLKIKIMSILDNAIKNNNTTPLLGAIYAKAYVVLGIDKYLQHSIEIFNIYKNKGSIIVCWLSLELYNASFDISYLKKFIISTYELLKKDNLEYIYNSNFLFFILSICSSSAYNFTQENLFLSPIRSCKYKDLILYKGIIVCIVKNDKALVRCRNIIQSGYYPFFTSFIIKSSENHDFYFSTKSIKLRSISPYKSLYYIICNNKVLSFTYDVFEILDSL